MAIVALKRIELVGHADDKEATLLALQTLGCVHLIPIHPERVEVAPAAVPRVREALDFLRHARRQRRQVTDPEHFDGRAVQEAALRIKHRLQDLRDERDFLIGRIESLAAWGDFELPPLAELGGYRLWFYIMPSHLVRRLGGVSVPWEIVHRGARHSYVVALSPEEPQDMPVERVRTGARPRHELEERLEVVELAIEDLEAERSGLTRWMRQMLRALAELEDHAALLAAHHQTWDDGPLFALTGWAPAASLPALRRLSAERRMALRAANPTPDDAPPTLLQNGALIESGQDLVTFYMTPGYFTWDPSGVVLLSFALFFAMILSDAGYAALLGLATGLYWDAMGRSAGGTRLRRVCALCVGSSLLYGALVGSYFGVALPPGNPLAWLKVADVANADLMMPLTVAIGGVHVLLANLVEARRLRRGSGALAPLGWATVVAGMLLWGAGVRWPALPATVAPAGQAALAVGVLLVLWFSRPDAPLGSRLLGGLSSITRLSSIFGDVLSYLRLFALGLASASLASAFNDLAGRVDDALGDGGVVVAALVLFVGHGLNVLLAVMGGVVHGLRLNAIEFFNWSLHEEGRPFRPFCRKEGAAWNP